MSPHVTFKKWHLNTARTFWVYVRRNNSRYQQVVFVVQKVEDLGLCVQTAAFVTISTQLFLTTHSFSFPLSSWPCHESFLVFACWKQGRWKMRRALCSLDYAVFLLLPLLFLLCIDSLSWTANHSHLSLMATAANSARWLSCKAANGGPTSAKQNKN